jgi:hypothetical protein
LAFVEINEPIVMKSVRIESIKTQEQRQKSDVSREWFQLTLVTKAQACSHLVQGLRSWAYQIENETVQVMKPNATDWVKAV